MPPKTIKRSFLISLSFCLGENPGNEIEDQADQGASSLQGYKPLPEGPVL
jgi:hypothetical protein